MLHVHSDVCGPTLPGFYLPDNTDTSDPKVLFKLFFNDDIVGYIYEYADLLQDRRIFMYHELR